MIKLSRMADYAVVIMACIAREEQAVLSAHDLALRTHITEATVSKLLKNLLKAKLLTSVRGARGGYSLARLAGAITIADIITAVDGPIALTDCVEGANGGCSFESLCMTKTVWQKINTTVRKAFEQVPLSEIT